MIDEDTNSGTRQGKNREREKNERIKKVKKKKKSILEGEGGK